jgi:hypothetical protein
VGDRIRFEPDRVSEVIDARGTGGLGEAAEAQACQRALGGAEFRRANSRARESTSLLGTAGRLIKNATSGNEWS